MTSSTPAATASATMYWIVGVSTMGRSSFGTALVAGRKRVPSPAAGMTALRVTKATDRGIDEILIRVAKKREPAVPRTPATVELVVSCPAVATMM